MSIVGVDLAQQLTRRYRTHLGYLPATQGVLRLLPSHAHGGFVVYVDDVVVGHVLPSGTYVGRKVHLALLPSPT